jgi:hypothetical protein
LQWAGALLGQQQQQLVASQVQLLSHGPQGVAGVRLPLMLLLLLLLWVH